MFWTIVFLIFIFAAVGFGIYGLVTAWGLDSIPPPPPIAPEIKSAVPISARIIRLTFIKGSGEIEVERLRVDNSTKESFLTTLDEVDDANLRRDTLYKYRARYSSSPNLPWSVEKEAKTLV